jgi:hypothetical protein
VIWCIYIIKFPVPLNTTFEVTFNAAHHPIIVIKWVFSDGTRKSFNKKFYLSSFFSLFPRRKLCWSLQKKKSSAIYLLS